MRHVLQDFGGAPGLVATFGRLVPASLVRPGSKSVKGMALLADKGHCAKLSDADLKEKLERVKDQVNVMRYTTGYGTRVFAVEGPSPEPFIWCRGAPQWVLSCLEAMGVVEHPDRLVGMRLDSIPQARGLGVSAVIALLHYVESAWHGGGMGTPAPLLKSYRPSCADLAAQWDHSEVSRRAAALIGQLGTNLPVARDLRFGALLSGAGAGDGTSRMLLDSIATDRSPELLRSRAQLVASLEAASLVTAQQEMMEIGAWTVAHHFEADRRERNHELFADRYGLRGNGASTLAAVGERYGMTRERVRQIISMMRFASRKQPIWAPAIQAALAACHQRLPGSAARIGAEPEVRALLGEHVTLANLQRFAADFLGMSPQADNLSIHVKGSARAGDIVVSSGDEAELVTSIFRVTSSMISHVGAAQVDWIASKVSKETATPVSDSDVVAVLEPDANFEWLAKDDGWFWLGGGGKNRLVSRLRKIVAVADAPLTIEEIYGGLIRSDRDRRPCQTGRRPSVHSVLVPALVVLEVCKRVGFASVNGHNHVRRTTACPTPAEVLADVDIAIYEAIITLGGIADRAAIRRSVLQRTGGPRVNFDVLFAEAPFVLQHGYSVYGLRGHRIDPGKLLRATKTVATEARRRRAAVTGEEPRAA